MQNTDSVLLEVNIENIFVALHETSLLYLGIPCYSHMTNMELYSGVTVAKLKKKKKTPWSESESELYRASDRRFSAKCCQLVRIEGATWSA
jgi:hypothetical protein